MNLTRLVIVVVAALALLALICWKRTEFYLPDASHYIGLAHSLLVSQSYLFNLEPHTRFPPGFPVTLAIVGALLGEGYAIFVRLMPIFGAIGLIASYSLIRGQGEALAAAAGTLLLASAPQFFSISTQVVGSDLPFFAATMGGLLVAQRMEKAGSSRSKMLLAIALALLVGYAVLLRMSGLALLTAILLWLATSIRERARFATRLRTYAPALILGITLQLSWMLWARSVRAPELPGQPTDSYFLLLAMVDPHRPELGNASAAEVTRRVANKIAFRILQTSELALRLRRAKTVWFSPLLLLPLVCVAVGVMGSLRELPAWYLLAYLGMLFLWPYTGGIRHVVPVFPLIVSYSWRGARIAAATLRRYGRFGLLAAAGLCAVLLIVAAVATTTASVQRLLSIVVWAVATGAFTLVALAGPANALASRLLRPPTLQVAGMATIAVLVVIGLVVDVRIARQNLGPDLTPQPSVEAAHWLQSHAPPGAVFMALNFAIIHRITGHQVVPFPVTSDAKLITQAMRARDVAFLVIEHVPGEPSYYTPDEQQRLDLVEVEFPGLLQPVHRTSDYDIFSVTPEP